MKNFIVLLFVLLLMAPLFSQNGFSQDRSGNVMTFEVNRIYPPVSITREKLNEAKSMKDLNKNFDPSWISEYISVEILTSHNGKIKKAVSKGETLSREQKDMMYGADTGTDISVSVRYIPENTLKHNDPKEFSFKFRIEPESEAKFPGGIQQLMKYIKENAIDKIPDGSFENYELIALKFTINEDGQMIDGHIFESPYQTYQNEKVEELLLETIRKMPNWKPAEYANGTKVKQEFVLTVGNHESCLMPLINFNEK